MLKNEAISRFARCSITEVCRVRVRDEEILSFVCSVCGCFCSQKGVKGREGMDDGRQMHGTNRGLPTAEVMPQRALLIYSRWLYRHTRITGCFNCHGFRCCCCDRHRSLSPAGP